MEIINATASNDAVAGYVFNALLIARAPLQLFQAIQGSLLPHLAGLDATGDSAALQSITELLISVQDAEK